MSDTVVVEKEVMEFGAEVGKVLKLVIHCLYTNKDIFLRELISNASDACDKLRYEALVKPELLQGEHKFRVVITSNKDTGVITVTDNGIGMNRQELIDNIGTIANSGTQRFLDQISGDNKKDIQLIGQFGVGFYSSFMVASEVTVVTRRAGENEGWLWHSDGNGSFTVEKSTVLPEVGTAITLKLREDALDYADRFRIRHIVNTYSDHISVPVLYVSDDNKEETLNKASALWTRPKAEITEEQYNEFYKHVAHSGDKPWLIMHNKNEGVIEYTNLLFVPTSKPFDLFHPDRKGRVKLYVKRVYITDEMVQLVPSYLRFLRGIVDSEDLPLNISRETLQHNNVIEKIKTALVKKLLGELKKKLADNLQDYLNFWRNFGPVVKEGLCESMEDRDAILEICLFRNSASNEYTALNDYIDRMREGQDAIYYLTGDDIDTMKGSPQLEGFVSRGIEVLLLNDAVDDFWVNVAHEYKDKPFKSAATSGIDLDKISTKKEETDQDDKKEHADATNYEDIINFIKQILAEKVQEVKLSNKLVTSPACLTVAEGSMGLRMERFLTEQKQFMRSADKIMEINIHHPVVSGIGKMLKEDALKERATDAVWLLYDQACILEGEQVSDPTLFAKRLNIILEQSFA
jgi:molecular chaperone HtpG